MQPVVECNGAGEAVSGHGGFLAILVTHGLLVLELNVSLQFFGATLRERACHYESRNHVLGYLIPVLG